MVGLVYNNITQEGNLITFVEPFKSEFIIDSFFFFFIKIEKYTVDAKKINTNNNLYFKF